MWDLIVSVPDHCLSFDFVNQGSIIHPSSLSDCSLYNSFVKALFSCYFMKVTVAQCFCYTPYKL